MAQQSDEHDHECDHEPVLRPGSNFGEVGHDQILGQQSDEQYLEPVLKSETGRAVR